MKELIAGRVMKTLKDQEGKEIQRSAAEIMAEIILEGMEGKLIISQGEKSITYANPLHAVKLYQDYMLKAKEMWLRAAELKKNEKRSGGGIRVVLPSVPGRLRSSRVNRGLRVPGLNVLYGYRARPGRERDPYGEVRMLRGSRSGTERRELIS